MHAKSFRFVFLIYSRAAKKGKESMKERCQHFQFYSTLNLLTSCNSMIRLHICDCSSLSHLLSLSWRSDMYTLQLVFVLRACVSVALHELCVFGVKYTYVSDIINKSPCYFLSCWFWIHLSSTHAYQSNAEQCMHEKQESIWILSRYKEIGKL